MSDDTPLKPLCFVLMPFGSKLDASGDPIDFDVVYSLVIKPAIQGADMEPIRADEEQLSGIIHKPMFERLILCDFAVADLTTANANVFYELGVRHGIRPQTTVPVFAEGSRLPFDLDYLRGVPYKLAGGQPADPEVDVERIRQALLSAKLGATDSPVFQLVTDLPVPDVRHLKTDVFREQVAYAEGAKQRLAAAAAEGKDAVDEVRAGLGPMRDLEAGVVVDLLLTYRSVGAWSEMVELVEELPDPMKRSVLVREQLGLALNRAGRSEAAERVLLTLIEENGPSSETLGILGRVYKDRWARDQKAGKAIEARGHLKKAIDAYLRGFESDWRDAYPGINAVTLMELAEPRDPRRDELLPVVLYSVKRRLASSTPNFWDHATLLELAVLSGDLRSAEEHAADALAAFTEPWQPKSTMNNLELIREARQARAEEIEWLDPIIDALASRATGQSGSPS